MPAGAGDGYLEVVGGRVDGTRGSRHRSGGELVLEVHPDDRRRLMGRKLGRCRDVERSRRRGLLAGLQDGQERYRKLDLARGSRHGGQGGQMNVMPARVHDAGR